MRAVARRSKSYYDRLGFFHLVWRGLGAGDALRTGAPVWGAMGYGER